MLDLPPFVIFSDGGGMLQAYEALADRLRATGQRVKVIRFCRSACTVLLGLPKGQICAAPEAEFWFHAASETDGTLRRKASAAGNAAFMRHYPPAVRAWLDARGGLKPTWTILRGAEMHALVPPCQ